MPSLSDDDPTWSPKKHKGDALPSSRAKKRRKCDHECPFRLRGDDCTHRVSEDQATTLKEWLQIFKQVKAVSAGTTPNNVGSFDERKDDASLCCYVCYRVSVCDVDVTITEDWYQLRSTCTRFFFAVHMLRELQVMSKTVTKHKRFLEARVTASASQPVKPVMTVMTRARAPEGPPSDIGSPRCIFSRVDRPCSSEMFSFNMGHSEYGWSAKWVVGHMHATGRGYRLPAGSTLEDPKLFERECMACRKCYAEEYKEAHRPAEGQWLPPAPPHHLFVVAQSTHRGNIFVCF